MHRRAKHVFVLGAQLWWKKRAAGGLKIEFPRFRDQIQTKTVVRFFAGEMKAGAFVDASRGIQMALCPKRDFFVARLAREANAFVHQSPADS